MLNPLLCHVERQRNISSGLVTGSQEAEEILRQPCCLRMTGWGIPPQNDLDMLALLGTNALEYTI
jgi:hypothetical protein